MKTVSAQFLPDLLQNRSYWTPPKSEFDIYDADMVRDGEHRHGEVLLTFAPALADTRSLSSGRAPGGGTIPTIEMNETATWPRGLINEQFSMRAVWRADNASLLRLSIAGNDGMGQIYQALVGLFDSKTSNVRWQYRCDTYRGGSEPLEFDSPQGPSIFHEELPLRVRMLDFRKRIGAMPIQLAPTIAGTERWAGAFNPATVTWKTGDRAISVDVVDSSGKEHLVLDADFPFLVREWQMADGSRLLLKNSLRVDPHDYIKNGDRERALKDPMLRHPD